MEGIKSINKQKNWTTCSCQQELKLKLEASVWRFLYLRIGFQGKYRFLSFICLGFASSCKPSQSLPVLCLSPSQWYWGAQSWGWSPAEPHQWQVTTLMPPHSWLKHPWCVYPPVCWNFCPGRHCERQYGKLHWNPKMLHQLASLDQLAG